MIWLKYEETTLEPQIWTMGISPRLQNSLQQTTILEQSYQKKSCHSGFPYPQPPHLFNTSISPVKIITSHNFQICSRTMSVCLCVCVYHVFSWAKWRVALIYTCPLTSPRLPQRKNYIDYISAKVSQNLLYTLARKVYNFQRLGLAAP